MRVVNDLERPIVYALTVIASAVSLLVYGSTLVRSGDGLLSFLRPVFGSAFALTWLALLALTFAVNRRWKGLLILILAFVVTLAVSMSPTRAAPLPWNEFLVSTATLALLVSAGCLHYELLD
jgi:hypothetical protein